MRSYEYMLKTRDSRRLYAGAFLFLLFFAAGSRVFFHEHSHDVFSDTTATVHAAEKHGDDCIPVIDCDDSHDSNTSALQDESPHCLLLPNDVLSFSRIIRTVELIASTSSRRDLGSLATPFLPPKHS